MAILKPIDANYLKIVALSPDDLLKNIFDFNELVYLESDANGSQVETLDNYSFFGINRVLNYSRRPIRHDHKRTFKTRICK